MEIINLTPHVVSILDADNNIVAAFEPAGLARCVMTRTKIDSVNGIAVNTNTYGDVTGLPAQKSETVYIVSQLVAQAVKGMRNDVLVTDDAVRNADGQIIGCRAFARIL